ncbi:hypothetical protein C8F01DRAFT_998739, partial [Mycena amicta]
MCAVPDQIEPKVSRNQSDRLPPATMMPQLATEIWLEILAELPRDSLPSVTLSNHHLCTLSQPLLFTHFEFHPYAIGGMDQILLPETHDIEHSLERLAFWCSPRIAPHVRTCVV